MAHGVSVRSREVLLLPLLVLSIVLLGLWIAACASRARQADPSRLPKPTVERCGEGPGPIEILAADVAVVIDRSMSTRTPTGVDLDGDGVVGEFRSSEYTDRGDSMLAAQLSAVARLVDVARLGGMRFAIVSYSGPDDFPLEDSVTQRVLREDARLESELTDDASALAAALVQVGRRGSDGTTSFAPAMKLALRSLRAGDDSAQPPRRRRVLFLSDSSTPVRYAPMRRVARDDRRMQLEAKRAIEAGIRFHSFALGSAAGAEQPSALAQIAGATGGIYRAVPDPRHLYCQMLAALGEGLPR